MSIKQQYTWQAFLKEFPEHKTKKTKRTSAEGKKAFEAAYKTYIKKYLAESAKRLERELAKVTARRDQLAKQVQALRKAKKFAKGKLVQTRAGRADAAIASLNRQKARTAAKQKNF